MWSYIVVGGCVFLAGNAIRACLRSRAHYRAPTLQSNSIPIQKLESKEIPAPSPSLTSPEKLAKIHRTLIEREEIMDDCQKLLNKQASFIKKIAKKELETKKSLISASYQYKMSTFQLIGKRRK